MAKANSQDKKGKQTYKSSQASDQDEPAISSQDPAEGRRDIGEDTKDTRTGEKSNTGKVPEQTPLSSQDPVEGRRDIGE
jgi:hypothetical protein